MRTSAIASLALPLAGCLGAPYKPPPVAVPQHWQETPSGAREQPSAGVPWSPAFGDPILEGLIRDAVADNLDLRAAEARVREARALRGVTASRGAAQGNGLAAAPERHGTKSVH